MPQRGEWVHERPNFQWAATNDDIRPRSNAILARAGAETLKSIATAAKGDPKRGMEELARRNLIRPITTQGHIGDVLPDKIVYDAQTTTGGSGGPLFNNEGKVIGINFAMVREFGGSNFAIPVNYGMSLLKP